MSELKISDYIDVDSIDGTELILVSKDGSYRKTTIEEIRNLASDIANTELAELLNKAASAQDVKNILNTINTNLKNHSDSITSINASLSDLANNKANKTDLINGSLRIAQRYNASDSTTFTNPSNKYIMDRFRCNGTGTVIPISSGGCTVTGTINFKYVMEKTDFALLPSTFTLSYGLNGVNNEIVVTKANCTIDSNGNGIIFDLNVTNATLNYVHYGKAPFVPRLYAEELALCKRYYESVLANVSGNIYGTNDIGFNSVPLTVTKRVNPTIALASGSIITSSGSATTGFTIGSNLSINTLSSIAPYAQKTSHGYTATSPVVLQGWYNADAEIY